LICSELNLDIYNGIKIGNKLILYGYITHVKNEHDFINGFLFYNFITNEKNNSNFTHLLIKYKNIIEHNNGVKTLDRDQENEIFNIEKKLDLKFLRVINSDTFNNSNAAIYNKR
jgi:hypothetical protein